MVLTMFYRAAFLLTAFKFLPISLGQITVIVNNTASHAIPSTLYGLMFEDISSGDGGLYAEMLQNRAFQKVTPNTSEALTAWTALNPTSAISVISDPLSAALPNALDIEVPEGTTGEVGFSNEGWWGIKVDTNWTYTSSLYYRFPIASDFSGPLNVSLRSSAGDILASSSITISASQTNWTQVNTTLKPDTAPNDNNNTFVVSIDGAGVSGQNIRFGLLSLFPPTFKGRTNGMRADIAEALQEIEPAFFRLPGGNNLGQTIDTRWQWNATIGELVDRPGRVGDWGYINTDGLGLYEYFAFCEDAGMEAIMAIWAGYSLGGQSIADGQLAPYIEQAIDQINFAIGDPASSASAAIRASMGHPDPFPLTYVEVGNEDFFSTTYTYRWAEIVTNLSTTFPDLKFIATTNAWNPILTPTPLQYDVHVYQTPDWFAKNSFYYDSFERNGTTYFEGEYAAISTNSSDIFGTPANGRMLYPTVQGSAGEAAFMTGLERNSDIVFAASYAPLLNNIVNTQWTPNLVNFDAGLVIKSTSYYVQKLFSLNKGDEYLPSTLPDANGTLFWSVTKRKATDELLIKISNTDSTSKNVTFQLPFANVASSGSVQLLTGAANASNTPDAPESIVPTNQSIITGTSFEYTAPAYSVAILTVVAS